MTFVLHIIFLLKRRIYVFGLIFLSQALHVHLYAQSWQDSYNIAIKAYSANDFNRTIQEGDKALAIATSTNEKLYTLKVLSATCYEIGNYKKGIEFGKQEVAICIAEAIPDSVYVNSLNNLTNNYIGLEEYQNAIPPLLKIIAIGEKLYEPNNLGHNQHLSDLGYSYLMITKYDSAIFYLSQANKYLLAIEGGAEDYLMNQLNIGQAYYQKHEYISSMRVFQGLQDILENNELSDYQLYAETIEGLGLVQYSIGKYAESQQSYEIASKKYIRLGFAVSNLDALNKQLALVYLKNDQLFKSDSIQAIISDSGASKNLLINQISLAYKRYTTQNYKEAKQIINKVLNQLTSASEDEELLAEAIMLNSRLNLELYGNSFIDSINMSIRIFSKIKKQDKSVEGLLIKAKIFQAQGANEKAISTFKTALSQSESLSNNYSLKYSAALGLLNVYLQLNQLDNASSWYNKIIAAKILNNSNYAKELTYTYGLLLQINGYNLESLEVLKPLANKTQYPELLRYQQILGKVYLDLSQTKKSLEIYREINQYLFENKNNSLEYAENLAQLGRVNLVLGEYSIAEGYYLRSIEILEVNPKTTARIFAPTYNSYAIYQQTIGNYNKAKVYYSKAKFFAKDNINLQVDIIQNLATLSQYEGEYYDAIILLKEAVTAYKAIYGDLHPYYATALQNLANAYNKYGDPLKGISLLEQAITIDKRNGLENSISYTNKQHNLAVILQETDELDRAKSIFNTVLESRKSLLGENHPDYIYSLYNMAVLLQKMEDNEQAKIYFKQVIEKYDFQIKSFFPYLSEQEKSKYYAKIKEAFSAFKDFAAEYSITDPTINIELYNFQLNHKAILLKSSKSIKKIIGQSNDYELITMYDDWIELKVTLAKYYSMPQKELELAGVSIDAVVEEANSLEKKLSLKSELFSDDLTNSPKTWQNIQTTLKAEEAAVEIIRIRKNIRNDSIWYVALIITPKASVPELIVLENGKDLESKYFKYYINNIKFKRKDIQSYKNFWKPIKKALGDTKRVYLASDGVYNKINISSLYIPEEDKYILDELIVHNLTNTLELTEDHQPFIIDKKFIISLIGDPSFDSKREDAFPITTLPETRIEIETIDSLAQINSLTTIKLLGAGASEGNIKNIESPNILHIATHGFFLADNDQSQDLYSMKSNPLMRSGLLLSGSQNSFRGDHIDFSGSIEDEDGILTAYEAMNMNLANTNLVILSACETGLGEVKNGEGVYGLQRAFIIAGAKSVLISLWKVDDRSTKELMILFYQNIFNGLEEFEALNVAQKELKEKYSLPYYWGAFVISGI